MVQCSSFYFVGWQCENVADALECFAFDEVNCRLPIKFLCLVELSAQKYLLALQVLNSLLYHPAQKAASELTFCVM
jgi:hypothetical protein